MREMELRGQHPRYWRHQTLEAGVYVVHGCSLALTVAGVAKPRACKRPTITLPVISISSGHSAATSAFTALIDASAGGVTPSQPSSPARLLARRTRVAVAV